MLGELDLYGDLCTQVQEESSYLETFDKFICNVFRVGYSITCMFNFSLPFKLVF